jgi:hypothetical protein
VRYRYQDYPIDLLRQLLTLDELTKLFWQLVLQTGGDVEEALRWMKYLQERGMIDPAIDLDRFREELEKRELIEDRNGTAVLTGAAERQIRRQALEEVFSGLKKSGAGYHATPKTGAGGGCCRRRAHTVRRQSRGDRRNPDHRQRRQARRRRDRPPREDFECTGRST